MTNKEVWNLMARDFGDESLYEKYGFGVCINNGYCSDTQGICEYLFDLLQADVISDEQRMELMESIQSLPEFDPDNFYWPNTPSGMKERAAFCAAQAALCGD